MVRAITLDLFLNKNTITIMNQSIGRLNESSVFYVVTRDGRRAWPKDYWTVSEAQAHADSLVAALKSFNDPSYKNIVIVETTDPSSIN